MGGWGAFQRDIPEQTLGLKASESLNAPGRLAQMPILGMGWGRNELRRLLPGTGISQTPYWVGSV